MYRGPLECRVSCASSNSSNLRPVSNHSTRQVRKNYASLNTSMTVFKVCREEHTHCTLSLEVPPALDKHV